jgi:hypothetical protein
MKKFTSRSATPMVLFVFASALSSLAVGEVERVSGVPLDKARICVTGYDHNRPDPFPGLGDFIGWVGGVERLANGDLWFVHSAGYWHVSFATPSTGDAVNRSRKDVGRSAAPSQFGQLLHTRPFAGFAIAGWCYSLGVV